MTLITPIRSDNAYFGFAKETTPGTPVAPSIFPRWMDGSGIEIDLKAEDVWEGDGSRRLGLIVKNRQMVKIKLSCTPRANELGFFEAAAMGAGSDGIVGAATPTPTTLASALTANSSTALSLTANLSLASGSGNAQLLVGAGTANAEIVVVTLPATGSGPYSVSVASTYNSGKVKNSHSSGESVALLTTINTTVIFATTVGATTIQLGNTINLTASGTATVVLSPGTANEEIATLVTPGSSGTFTVAASGTLKKAHSVGDVVASPAVHPLSDQDDGSYYTIEVGLGSLNGANGTTLRVRDCKLETIKRSAKAGSILMYEMEWVGIASSVQGTPATLAFETHSPFLYTQGSWTLDGSTSSDEAISIEQFDIAQKNNLDTGIQTEQLTLAALIFGNINVDLGFDVVYTNPSKVYLTYFGSATGTTDSQTLGLGSFNVTFTQPDTFQSVTYNIATTNYTKNGLPSPKKDGKHYKQTLSASSTSNQAANSYVLQTTINNMQYALY